MKLYVNDSASCRRAHWKELELLSELCHPNIVPIIGACMSDTWSMPGAVVLRMQRTLWRAMTTEPTVDPARSRRILTDVAAGMAWFHGKHPDRFHGELAPKEIALQDNDVAAVIIFGNLWCSERQMLACRGQVTKMMYVRI